MGAPRGRAPSGDPGPSGVGTMGVSRKPRCRNGGGSRRLVLINPDSEHHAPSPQRFQCRKSPRARGQRKPKQGSHLPIFTVLGTLTPHGEGLQRSHTGLMGAGRRHSPVFLTPSGFCSPPNLGRTLLQTSVWIKKQSPLLAFAKTCGLTAGELGASRRLPGRARGAPAGLEGAQEEQKGISARSVEAGSEIRPRACSLGAQGSSPSSLIACTPGPQPPLADLHLLALAKPLQPHVWLFCDLLWSPRSCGWELPPSVTRPHPC